MKMIIPVGVDKTPYTEVFHPGYLTEEQFEAVWIISLRSDFEYFCTTSGGIFDPGASGSCYQGPILIMWCDTNGKFHGVRIGKRGNILKEVVA